MAKFMIMAEKAIPKAGSPCWKCGMAIAIGVHGKDWRPKPSQRHFFRKWLHCVGCKAVFFSKGDRIRSGPTSPIPPSGGVQQAFIWA